MREETKQRVFDAADALAAQLGKAPSNSQVADRLGSGSNGTISPAMKEWRENYTAQRKMAGVEVPSDVVEAFSAASKLVLGSTWAAAVEYADRTLAGERAKMAEDQEELKTEMDNADFDRDAARDESASLKEQVTSLTTEVNVNIGLSEKLAIAATARDVAEAQNVELRSWLASEKERNQGLDAKLSALQAENSGMKARLAILETK
jgi:hypothetical protein